MKIIKSIHAYRRWRGSLSPSQKVGFVPTMGALHEGHLSLIRRCRTDNHQTVVSIFVNPIQFGPKEDFSRYPRPWGKDVELLNKEKVDILFAPSRNHVFGPHHSTRVRVPSLNHVLCGTPRSRGPGHFDGVATVVAALFNIIQPHRAYFGLKDFQQVRVIEQMVEDLHFPVDVVRCPTVRAPDGLALSSRNAYLSPRERALAPGFYAALQQGRKLLTSQRKMTPHTLQKRLTELLESIPHTRVDYVELVNAQTLLPLKTWQKPLLLAAAVKMGRTRLIDNILVK